MTFEDVIYVAVYPVDMAENWEKLNTGLPNPISVLHTQTTCSRCSTLVWIGPQQREEARKPDRPIVCYRCIFAEQGFREAGAVGVISVNPSIDDEPRRY